MSNVFQEPPDTGVALAHNAEPMVGGGAVGEDAKLAPQSYDYSRGILLEPGTDVDETASQPQFLVPQNVDWPIGALRAFDVPHEATHRRYEPPVIVGVNQSAPGYTALVQPVALHYVKVLGGVLSSSAAATIVFQHGSGVAADPAIGGDQPGLGISQMGAFSLATGVPLILPVSDPENPWLFCAPDLILGLTSATTAVKGWLVVCFSPYDL
jgi:hypothetical protein